MTYKAVIQFLDATSNDQSLQSGLASVIGVGDGNISSAQELDKEEAQALLGKRGVLVTAFAEEQGYNFTLPELNSVVSLFQEYQSGALSESDFSRALGMDTAAEGITNPLKAIGKTVGMVFLGVKYHAAVDESSAHDVLAFMKKTAEDAEFREKLKGILTVGDGDISDFSTLDADELTALRSGRGALVAEFAAQHGFKFTLSDLLAVTDAFARVQSGELTSDEFDKFLNLQVKSKDFFPFIDNMLSMTYKGAEYHSPVVSKSKDNTLPVIRFMQRSGSDAGLREQLVAILGGDGNISSPLELDAEEAKALSSERSSQIIDLGARHGYRFTISDLSAVLGAFQLVNDGQLSLESCNRILGLGKPEESALDSVKKTAGLMYRGVAY